jgi:hypothetical protein
MLNNWKSIHFSRLVLEKYLFADNGVISGTPKIYFYPHSQQYGVNPSIKVILIRGTVIPINWDNKNEFKQILNFFLFFVNS